MWHRKEKVYWLCRSNSKYAKILSGKGLDFMLNVVTNEWRMLLRTSNDIWEQTHYVVLLWNIYRASVDVNVPFLSEMLTLSLRVELFGHIHVYSNKLEQTEHLSCDTLTKRRRQEVKEPSIFMLFHLWNVSVYGAYG